MRKLEMRKFKTSALRQGNDQVKEHEIDNAYSTNNEKRIHVGFWWDSQKERDNWENIVAGGRILLQYALEIEGLPLWSTGQSSWLQIRWPGFDSRHYQKKSSGSGTGSTQPRENN
jgi:hypothetical protein